MQYQFEIAEQQDEGDLVGEFEGIGVLVDPVSAGYLNGAQLDYASSDFSSQFVLKNPNAQVMCGCGKSFSG